MDNSFGPGVRVLVFLDLRRLLVYTNLLLGLEVPSHVEPVTDLTSDHSGTRLLNHCDMTLRGGYL